MEHMEYEMEELLPLVAALADQYTSRESTSVTYEKAQQLMEAVLYCIQECGRAGEISLPESGSAAEKIINDVKNNPPEEYALTVEQAYRRGYELVKRKTDSLRQRYNHVALNFCSYGNHYLEDTFLKGIPEFLKWYDPKFAPQDTILTLDYPILTDLGGETGVDAVYRYVCAVGTEQEFLGKFAPQYVRELLSRYTEEPEELPENICGIVLWNTLGHVILGKPLSERGFLEQEYEKLGRIFTSRTAAQGVDFLKAAAEKLIGGENAYFRESLCALAVRAEYAAKNGCLERIFFL